VDKHLDAHPKTVSADVAGRQYGSNMAATAATLTSPSADSAREVARELILCLASGDITREQMTALRDWLAADRAHQAAFEAERAVWRGLAPLRDPLSHSLAASPCEPDARRSGVLPASRRRVRWVAAGAALAACLMIFIVAGDVITRLRADHVTGIGEVAQFKLPDGSIAMLNTDSAIAVRYAGSERRIDLLRGEAWFKVRKDAEHPFRVHARDGVAEAVGTAFGVRRGDDNVTISVTEGVVAVTAPEQSRPSEPQSVKVSRGLQSSYAPGHAPGAATAFDAQVALAWRSRHIVIDDMPLGTAIEELNRYRSGRIVLFDGAHGDAHVSGVFAVDQLDQGVAGLAATQGLSVTYVTPYLMILR
jgi:transmembrane sensor